MKKTSGFTIIELLIVIVIIGLLATLTIIAYSGIVSRSISTSLQSDLTNNSKKLKLYQAQYGSFPTALSNNCPSYPTATPNDPTYCLVQSGSNSISGYFGSTKDYTLKMSNSNTTLAITESSAAATNIDGILMQTVTSANCPVALTRAVDARDNHSYWIKKLADGKCWMLTNLGYAGGGTNTYGDTRTLIDGTSSAETYTAAHYFILPSTVNYTVEPATPSTSMSGTGQYGYLYNFCGVNGGQTGNGACSGSSSTAVNTTISVCPYGWQLPASGNFTSLNAAINSGSSTSYAGLIDSPWFGQFGGLRINTVFGRQGSLGMYWSYSQLTSSYGYALHFETGIVFLDPYYKIGGLAVRCIAS